MNAVLRWEMPPLLWRRGRYAGVIHYVIAVTDDSRVLPFITRAPTHTRPRGRAHTRTFIVLRNSFHNVSRGRRSSIQRQNMTLTVNHKQLLTAVLSPVPHLDNIDPFGVYKSTNVFDVLGVLRNNTLSNINFRSVIKVMIGIFHRGLQTPTAVLLNY